MKKVFLRLVTSFIVLLAVPQFCAAQLDVKITQNPTYPCDIDTSSGTGGGPDCIHVCLGDTVAYTTDGQGQFHWELSGNGTIISGQGTQTVVVVWNSPGTYQVMVIIQGPDGNPKVYHLCVIVEQPPTAVIGFDAGLTIQNGCIKICNNTTINFNSTGSYANILSSDWDFGDGFTTSTTGTTVSHTYTTPGNYIVTLTVHSACCTGTVQYCVNVDPATGPDIFCITPVCGGTEGVKYCTGAVCGTYNWSILGGTGTIQGPNNTNCVLVNWGAGPVGTLSLATTLCTPATCPVATVATVPIMPNGGFIIGGPQLVCAPSVHSYSAPVIPGAQYTWTLFEPCGSTTTTLPTNAPPYIQNITFPCLGQYILTCHMSNDLLDCVGDTSIIINAVGSFSISGPDTICENSTVSFTSLPFNCDWNIPSVGSATNSNNPSFTFSTAGTYTVTATPAFPNVACNSPQTLTVVVLAAPTQATISPNPTVCPGTPYTYTASGSGPGVTYNWSSTGGITFNNATANPVSANIPNIFSSGTITVTPVNSAGCAGIPTTITVNGYATPTPTITGPSAACPDVNTTYNISLSYPGVSNVNITINPANAGVIVNQTLTTVDIKWFVIVPPTATITISETICGNLTGTFTTPTINILPLPTPTAAASGGCVGTNVSLTATGGTGYAWYLATGGASIGSGSPLSTPYVAPGNYYVVATGANGCTKIAYALAAEFPGPTVSNPLGPTTGSCDPLTGLFSPAVTLQTANGPYTFSWSNGGTNFSTTVTTPGTYSVTVTTANGCTKTQSHTILCGCAVPCPTCVDGGTCDLVTGNLLSPTTLTSPAAGSYSWSPGGQTTQTISTIVPGLYSVTVPNPGNLACPTSTTSFYVHCTNDVCPYSGNPVCTANTPIVSQGNPNCNDFTFTTNSNCAGTAVWSFGDGSPGASGNTVTHTYSQIGTYQVCYTFGGNGPCDPGATACTSITVPVAANFSTLVNCNMVQFTDLTNFFSGSISGWLWQFGDPANSTSTLQNPSFTYLNGGTYNVTLTATVGLCQAKITIPVTVVGPIITTSIVTSACNAPVQFTAADNGSNPPVVSWSWNFGDGTFSTDSSPSHTFPPPGPLSYTVTVTATSGAGCSTTASGTVTINPPPAPFNLIYTSPGCGNVLLDAGAGYTSYQWYMSGTAISGQTNQTYTAIASGNYYCVVTDLNGCIIQSNTASIVVNPLPVIVLTASPQPLCTGQVITLNSGLGAGYNVKWFDNLFALLFTGSTYSPGMLPAGTYTYNVIAVDNATGCQSNAAITITINPAPTVTISNSNPAGICAPSAVTLTATGLPASVTYAWSNGAITPVINVYSSGLYTVVVTDPASGCTASAVDNVIIFPLPDLSLLPIGCDSGCINPLADTIHGPPGMSMYDWQINGVNVSNLQDLGLNPGNLPNYGVAYVIKLIATTVNGCVDSTTFEYTPRSCDSSDCYTMTDTIWCNLDGTYSFQISVENMNAVQSASIMLNNFTSPFMVNGLSYYYQFLNLPPNSSSGWFPATPLILSLPPNTPVPTEFCLHSIVIYGDTCCYDSICIPIPNCVPCDNISISSTAEDSSCCKTVSLYNNYNGGYFSGIQVTPITVGATIGSTYLGGAYTGSWNSPLNNASTVIYKPNAGFIPTGNTTGLFTMCLSLAPGTPSPQIVVLNWLTPNALGDDSIACTDTLKFYCISEPINPCGTVEDTIICLGNGTYQYSFTLTNNSANAISQAVIDYLNPTGVLNSFPLVFNYPPLAPGGTYTQTFTFNTALPAGSVVCFHITLLDSIGCCCHAVDTVCFTIPDCEVTCACGHWDDIFDIHLSPVPAGSPSDLLIECGAALTNLEPGVTISFTSPMYFCTGNDATCTSNITWNIPGASPSSGTGLPVFTLNTAGTYTLKLYASCGGSVCDSCTISFVVTNPCSCGQWLPFTSDVTVNGSTSTGLSMACGAHFDGVLTGSTYNFTSGGFSCNGVAAVCQSQVTWSMPGASPSSGTGLPVFTFNTAGTYTLTMYGYCGGNLCDSCSMTFFVSENCNCGSWNPFTITTSNVSYINQPCGGIYNSKLGFPITVNGNYACQGGADCSATYSWVINKGAVFFMSGTSMPIVFNPSAAGSYTVTINATCNGVSCGSCTFTFKLKSPAPSPQIGALSNSEKEAPAIVQLKATPNPTRGAVTLHFVSPASESGTISWFDELGNIRKQLITSWEGTETDIEMNVSDLAEGIYLVRFNGTSSSGFTKVVVFR
ncbi:MAG: PKD domain-containing protein [Chitinophagaceae bacterium]|nr:PKD domain-containing protein [Chitinophagaceae bacterium]